MKFNYFGYYRELKLNTHLRWNNSRQSDNPVVSLFTNREKTVTIGKKLRSGRRGHDWQCIVSF